MKIFDKATIENLSLSVDEEVVQNSLSIFSLIIEKSISDLAKSNALITPNFELQTINEFYTGAILPNSRIDLLLILKNPQLEINTSKLLENKMKSFWTRLKYAWKNRKKKKKKQKYIQKTKSIKAVDKSTYNISHFSLDLLNKIANNIEKDCIVTLNNGILEIAGQGLAFSCRIFPVFDRGGTYNFYLTNKNKFFNIDLQNRDSYLEELLENYGDRFTELCRVFSSLYYNFSSTRANSLFIESLIANLPKDAFSGASLYQSFVFAVNYLTNKKQSELFAITDVNKRLSSEKLCGVSSLEISSFMKNLQKYL
ncbi:MAG: hypothetical protein IKT27_02845 [Clostridia bacterium]|nr:hypothetical protein [Clostridia bacterium]